MHVDDLPDCSDFKLFPDPLPESPSLAPIVGSNVRYLRKREHFNKQTFACMVGIGRPLLDKIECGEADIRLSYLERIADAFDIEVADLLVEHDGIEDDGALPT